MPRAIGRIVGGGVSPVGPIERPSPALAGRYVSLDALRAALDGLDWTPLRLADGRRTRAPSPRLPHAVVLHLAVEAREALAGSARGESGIAAVTVHADAQRLARFVGAEPEMIVGVLDALAKSRVLLSADTRGDAQAPMHRLTPGLLGPDPRCAALDWRAVALGTVGSPSAWVAAHVLAELLDAEGWTPVPRSVLERALDCGVSGLRAALDRLVSAAIVERQEQRGGVSVYRFAAGAWRQGREASAIPPSPEASRGAPVPVSTVAPPSAPADVRAPAALQENAGMRLLFGGVELEVPAGLRARVEIGPDGRPVVRIVGTLS